MNAYPVVWSFKREGSLPIIVIMAQSTEKEREVFLVKKAAKFIAKAQEFRGVPRPKPIHPSDGFALTVAFSLIFPSQALLNKFIEFISKERL